MKYLLDTHYLLWSISDSSKLPGKIKDVLVDPENEIIVSTISLWEISLKTSIGKLQIEGFTPADLPALCAKLDFQIVALGNAESSTYHLLKASHHKDPFDRMLIWQAITTGYTLITGDEEIKKYVVDGLKVLV